MINDNIFSQHSTTKNADHGIYVTGLHCGRATKPKTAVDNFRHGEERASDTSPHGAHYQFLPGGRRHCTPATVQAGQRQGARTETAGTAQCPEFIP